MSDTLTPSDPQESQIAPHYRPSSMFSILYFLYVVLLSHFTWVLFSCVKYRSTDELLDWFFRENYLDWSIFVKIEALAAVSLAGVILALNRFPSKRLNARQIKYKTHPFRTVVSLLVLLSISAFCVSAAYSPQERRNPHLKFVLLHQRPMSQTLLKLRYNDNLKLLQQDASELIRVSVKHQDFEALSYVQERIPESASSTSLWDVAVKEEDSLYVCTTFRSLPPAEFVRTYGKYSLLELLYAHCFLSAEEITALVTLGAATEVTNHPILGNTFFGKLYLKQRGLIPADPAKLQLPVSRTTDDAGHLKQYFVDLDLRLLELDRNYDENVPISLLTMMLISVTDTQWQAISGSLPLSMQTPQLFTLLKLLPSSGSAKERVIKPETLEFMVLGYSRIAQSKVNFAVKNAKKETLIDALYVDLFNPAQATLFEDEGRTIDQLSRLFKVFETAGLRFSMMKTRDLNRFSNPSVRSHFIDENAPRAIPTNASFTEASEMKISFLVYLAMNLH